MTETQAGLPSLLLLLFITLKLCHVIDWSWWAVMSPLWGPILIVMAFVGFCAFMHLLTQFLNGKKRR